MSTQRTSKLKTEKLSESMSGDGMIAGAIDRFGCASNMRLQVTLWKQSQNDRRVG
jgi:hypothetical protein